MSKILELGERINEAIKNSNYKAKEVADAISVSPQAISKAIRSHSMSKSNLRLMADFLGVDTDWLVTGRTEAVKEIDIELMSKCIAAIKKATIELGMTDLDEIKMNTAALMLYQANQ